MIIATEVGLAGATDIQVIFFKVLDVELSHYKIYKQTAVFGSIKKQIFIYLKFAEKIS